MGAPAPAPRSGLKPPIPLTPRAAAPAAACVAGRSRGQHMPPQQPSKQTATAPHKTKKGKQKAHQYSSRRSSGVTAPNGRSSARPAQRIKTPNPPNPSCCRSRGGMRGWPLPRPTHAPATTLKTNGNSAPTKPKKQKAHCERILVASLQRRRRRRMGAPAPAPRSGLKPPKPSILAASLQ